MPKQEIEKTFLAFDLLFDGRRDAYGIIRPDGSVECIRQPWSLAELAAHFFGKQPLAVYPVNNKGTCWWACLDLDCAGGPEAAFGPAKHVRDTLAATGITTWVERSKTKGYHIWVFFAEPVPAAIARALFSTACKIAKVPDLIDGQRLLVEIFPKQESLKPGQVGNCMALPYRGDVPPGKCVVLDQDGREMTAEEFATAALENRTSAKQVRAAFAQLLEQLENEKRNAEEEKTTFSLPLETIVKITEILVPFWKKPDRHTLALGLSGFLIKRGFDHQSIEILIRRIVKVAGDEELHDRLTAVRTTYDKLKEGGEISGVSFLAEKLPTDILQKLFAFVEETQESQKELDEEIAISDEVKIPAFLTKPPVRGLLKEICDYFALSTDANLEVRFAAALGLLSLLVNRRVYLREGRRKTYPNLWIFVIGPSSDTRKSTLQFLCKELWNEVVTDENILARMFPERDGEELTNTGIKEDEKPAGREIMKDPLWDDDFSPEALSHKLALISAVCKYTVGMIFTDEASWYLEALQKKDYLSGTLGQMLKLYDCPRKTSFERRQGGRRTPYQIENVFLNWFLVTTPQTLIAAATDQVKYSGFFQRCLLIPAGPREKEPEDFQPPVPDEVTTALAQKLKIVALFGPAEASFSEEAKQVYNEFKKELWEFRQNNPSLLEAELIARLDTITKKLAVLLEVAKKAETKSEATTEIIEEEDIWKALALEEETLQFFDEELIISKEATEDAIALARYFWQATIFVVENWLSPGEFKADRLLVMNALQRCKGKCSKSVLLKKTDLPVKRLDEILATLVARKEIIIERIEATMTPGKRRAGRPKEVISLPKKN